MYHLFMGQRYNRYASVAGNTYKVFETVEAAMKHFEENKMATGGFIHAVIFKEHPGARWQLVAFFPKDEYGFVPEWRVFED